MSSLTILLLVALLVGVPAVAAYDFYGRRNLEKLRSMFYNVGYIEVVDARERMGLHIPSEKDDFNTWYKVK